MTEENHCYENAMAERVKGILKDEFYLDQVFFIILPESWTKSLVKKSLNLTKRYDQTNPTQIHA